MGTVIAFVEGYFCESVYDVETFGPAYYLSDILPTTAERKFVLQGSEMILTFTEKATLFNIYHLRKSMEPGKLYRITVEELPQVEK